MQSRLTSLALGAALGVALFYCRPGNEPGQEIRRASRSRWRSD